MTVVCTVSSPLSRATSIAGERAKRREIDCESSSLQPAQETATQFSLTAADTLSLTDEIDFDKRGDPIRATAIDNACQLLPTQIRHSLQVQHTNEPSSAPSDPQQ